MLGGPRAAFAVVTFAGATALAIHALTVQDSTARYAAALLLIGLGGLAAGMLVQLRHVLERPVVADDASSLTADVTLRVEDARHVATPSVVWCLPTVSVLATGLGWWTVAWIAFVALSVIALALITARTAPSSTVAQHVMSAR
ncbi:hypothetical protein [Streptomyces monomycini]|uniref:hypothetical protein n=1 Tax=Streptomyces monomycini TaxID=371720 RepID=UPI00067DF54F|nr:hypothetical protein [Streptomyces monomycini]